MHNINTTTSLWSRIVLQRNREFFWFILFSVSLEKKKIFKIDYFLIYYKAVFFPFLVTALRVSRSRAGMWCEPKIDDYRSLVVRVKGMSYLLPVYGFIWYRNYTPKRWSDNKLRRRRRATDNIKKTTRPVKWLLSYVCIVKPIKILCLCGCFIGWLPFISDAMLLMHFFCCCSCF